MSQEISTESYFSSDDEASEVDPFRHRIKMSNFRWLRTYLLTPILVPLRFILLIVVGMVSHKMSQITIFGYKHFRQKFDIFS